MAELGQHLDLRLKLVNALLGQRVPTLDCHLHPTIYLTVVYIPKPTFAKEKGFIKVICGSLDLHERDVVAKVGFL